MSLPNELQRHALWKMDGRIWIEVMLSITDPLHQKMRERSINKGWMIPIDPKKLQEFVDDILTDQKS